jgi:hypothetical protein
MYNDEKDDEEAEEDPEVEKEEQEREKTLQYHMHVKQAQERMAAKWREMMANPPPRTSNTRPDMLDKRELVFFFLHFSFFLVLALLCTVAGHVVSGLSLSQAAHMIYVCYSGILDRLDFSGIFQVRCAVWPRWHLPRQLGAPVQGGTEDWVQCEGGGMMR